MIRIAVLGAAGYSAHLIPMDRGILTTTYSTPRGKVGEERVLGTLRELYPQESFARVIDEYLAAAAE